MPNPTMDTRCCNKKVPSGEIAPSGSKRVSSPSAADPLTGTKRTKLVTPGGKSQTPLAKLRSRFGCDTGVESEEDSEASEAANTEEAKMPKSKTGANDDLKTTGRARRNKKIKMFASYKSTNHGELNDNRDETTLQNVVKLPASQKKALVRELLEENDDSIPDSEFPDWI
jgi:hypothetical protein